MANDLIAELDRLHHRANDMRARERQLADAGENDPASDAWKTAAILAASAESEFEIALVEAWPAVSRQMREADQWRARESETQDALQAIGDKVLTGIMANVPDALHLTGMGSVVNKRKDGTYAPDDGWVNRTVHGLAGVLCRARADLAALQGAAPAGEGGGS